MYKFYQCIICNTEGLWNTLRVSAKKKKTMKRNKQSKTKNKWLIKASSESVITRIVKSV